MISKFRADLGLLSVTVFWGTTFILSKQTLETVPLPVFLFLRLTIAAVALNLYALKFRSQWTRQTVYHGALIGFFLYLSYFFQMWGIQYTTASNAGFITGLSVILVPIMGFVLFRFKPAPNVIIGIVLAVAGLLLLTGANPLNWNKGDLLVLVCSFTVALHVIYTGKFAPLNNVYLLTAAQLTMVSLLTIIALPFTTFTWPDLSVSTISLLIYLGLFGTVYTFLMQTAMQRYTTTARTALIFTMEPVFAALFAYLIAGEMLMFRGWLGGGLIFVAMVVAEIPWQQLKRHRPSADN